MKVGYFLIFIFAILNFLGLKQTEFEIRQLDSTARILTTHAEAIQAAQEQQPLKLPRRLQQPKPQRLWSRS